MIENNINIDLSEQSKFDELAGDWWNKDGKLKTLHDLNSVRLEYITENVPVSGKSILDIGCGGGILSEALATRGGMVTGIDISSAALEVARSHSAKRDLSIRYELSNSEQFAISHQQSFDVVTCMEMLEHVPDPVSIISACATLLKPGGNLFLSTINRTTTAYLAAIVGAEYVMNLLPRGTHDYARFIRPSELANWCQKNDLSVLDISGTGYLPILRKAFIKKSPDVNYLLHARKN